MSNRAKDLRRAAGFSQVQACVLAQVSIVTWRVFEANPSGISREKRALCEAALRKMAERVERGAA